MKRHTTLPALVTVLLILCGSAARAQSSPRHQVRPEHDPLTFGIVEHAPGMDGVRIARDVTFKTVEGRSLGMDVYSPSDASKAKLLPVVIFVNGVGDAPGRPKLRTWGQYTSWPRLIAASGMIAVTFDTRAGDANAEDIRDAFAYVREKGRSMGIDPSRIGAWSCSANVRTALPLLMQPGAPFAVAAVVYYGSADVEQMRADLPVLLVRAGRDRPQQNEQIDRLTAQALAANAPWTVVNLPSSRHAFDVFDDTDESRAAIRKTVEFLGGRLEARPATTREPDEARQAAVHLMMGEWAEAAAAYASYVRRHPDDADALVFLGNAQVELKQFDEVAVNFKKAIAMDPTIGEAWALLGRIEADKKNYAAAIEDLSKAIALMPDDAEAHFQLGKVRLAQDDAPAAVVLLEKAVELAPGNGWAWNSLAFAYLAAKQPAKAASSFERVLPFAPKNPGLLYNAACAYALAGDAGKAIELLDRAVTEGFKDKAGLMSDPDLAGIRGDPRFTELVKKLG